MKLEFSWEIFEKYSKIKFHENLPVGAELFHEDGRTDMKFIVAFRNSANEPKTSTLLLLLDDLFFFKKKQTNAKYSFWRHCIGSWERITRSHSVEKSLWKRMWTCLEERLRTEWIITDTVYSNSAARSRTLPLFWGVTYSGMWHCVASIVSNILNSMNMEYEGTSLLRNTRNH